MRASLKNIWLPRLVTFGLAGIAAGSAAFWVLQWPGLAFVTPIMAVDVQPVSAFDNSAVARALGGAGAGTGARSVPSALATTLDASRFALTGVVASNSQRGAALIAVDGKPAKPYAVGALVGEGWMLKSVQPRRAVFVRGGDADAQALPGTVEMVLELPALTQK
jgi:general secretion pathway protein C